MKRAFPYINRVPITEDDCWRWCERRGIVVRRAPLGVQGYTGTRKVGQSRKPYILIDERLEGLEFLQAFLHEIGHVVLHEPLGLRDALYLKRENPIDTKQEVEADMFMLLALIPLPKLAELAQTPIDEIEFPTKLLLERRRLYELTGV